MPVCSSGRLFVSMKQLLFQWRAFYEHFLNKFSNICLEIQQLLKSDKITGTLHLDRCKIMIKCHILEIKSIIYNFTDLFKTQSYV